MKAFMNQCKLEVTEAEIEEMFNEIDEDGSGTIEQDEFLSIISRKNIEPNLESETREVFKVIDENILICRYSTGIMMELLVGWKSSLCFRPSILRNLEKWMTRFLWKS